jgi:hypothetical protein
MLVLEVTLSVSLINRKALPASMWLNLFKKIFSHMKHDPRCRELTGNEGCDL